MKSDLAHLLTTASDPVQAFNWMREYLQARILAELQAQGAMIPLTLSNFFLKKHVPCQVRYITLTDH